MDVERGLTLPMQLRLVSGLMMLNLSPWRKNCPPSHGRNKSKSEPKLELHFFNADCEIGPHGFDVAFARDKTSRGSCEPIWQVGYGQ
jgi:hypothetical protein